LCIDQLRISIQDIADLFGVDMFFPEAELKNATCACLHETIEGGFANVLEHVIDSTLQVPSRDFHLGTRVNQSEIRE
jgi:hypothetical protein